MSNLILPKTESTRTTSSITFTVFVILVGLISFITVPNFSSTGQLFGLLFLTFLITAIISTFDIMKRIPIFYTSNRFKYHEFWVGDDNDIIIKHPNFKLIYDNSISKLIFSLGLFVFSLIVALKGKDLFNSLFELQISTSNITISTQIIIGIMFALAAILIYKQAERDFYIKYRYTWVILWMNRFQREGKIKLVSKLNSYIKDSELDFAYNDIYDGFYKPAINYLHLLLTNMDEFYQVYKKTEKNDGLSGYPELSSDFQYWSSRDRLSLQEGWQTGHTWHDVLSNSIIKITKAKQGEYDGNGLKILFSLKSNFNADFLKLQSLIERITCLDYYFTKIHEYFTKFIIADIGTPDLIIDNKSDQITITRSDTNYHLLTSIVNLFWYLGEREYIDKNHEIRIRWKHKDNLYSLAPTPTRKFKDKMNKHYKKPIWEIKNKYSETHTEDITKFEEFVKEIKEYNELKRDILLKDIIDLNELQFYLQDKPFDSFIGKYIELRTPLNAEFERIFLSLHVKLAQVMKRPPIE